MWLHQEVIGHNSRKSTSYREEDAQLKVYYEYEVFGLRLGKATERSSMGIKMLRGERKTTKKLEGLTRTPRKESNEKNSNIPRFQLVKDPAVFVRIKKFYKMLEKIKSNVLFSHSNIQVKQYEIDNKTNIPQPP